MLHLPVHPLPDFAVLLAPLSLGIAWFLPAIATGIGNLFKAFSNRSARNNQQKQIDARWQQYQTDWAKWRDADNARRDALGKYLTENGYADKYGPGIMANLTTHTIGNAPGRAPKVEGSFFNDFLGATAASIPQLMSTFSMKGGFPGGDTAASILAALGPALGGLQPQPGFRPINPGNREPITLGPGGGSGSFPTPTPWPSGEAPWSPNGASVPNMNPAALGGDEGDWLDSYLNDIYSSGFEG